MPQINIGIIGFGTVGSGVVKTLMAKAAILRRRTGLDLRIKYVCDKELKRRRIVSVGKPLLTKDAKKVLRDPDVDIVVELIGGIHPAKEIVLGALKAGKSVVTANKALLAECGREIFTAAKKYGAGIRFEGSVCGGVPVIKVLQEAFIPTKIDAIYGILNGTSNYILTEMAEKGREFKDVLKQAQAAGYAERDSSLDVGGFDSAHKLAILALLGFGKYVKPSEIFTDGILDISASDIRYAKELGYIIKLLGIAKRQEGELEVRVHPTLVPVEHPLSTINGIYNAVYVKGDLLRELLLYGEGAGQWPTSNAVTSDIIDLAKQIAGGVAPEVLEFDFGRQIKRLRRIDTIKSRYYVRFSAIDKPGVLAAISGILARYKISIASVSQKERRRENVVPIVMMTHEASERGMRAAIKKIDGLSSVKKKTVVIRIEG